MIFCKLSLVTLKHCRCFWKFHCRCFWKLWKSNLTFQNSKAFHHSCPNECLWNAMLLIHAFHNLISWLFTKFLLCNYRHFDHATKATLGVHRLFHFTWDGPILILSRICDDGHALHMHIKIDFVEACNWH